MTLRIASRFAMRELRGGLRGFRVFLACLALGVAAIAAVGTVRAGIEAGLKRDGAALLGGDAEVEFTYRFARDAELEWLYSIADKISATVEFRSMAVVGEERGLTQVRAVDDAYPLIGAVRLDPPMPIAVALANYGGVMERVLVDRMGLKPGDTFKLGTQEFTLRAVLDHYPDNVSGGFGLGPRTIVRTDALTQSGLLTEGTLFSTQYRLDLPDGASLATLGNRARNKFGNDGLRWRDSRRGAGGTATFIDRIGAFLVLVGLSGLAVGGIGVSSAVTAYLAGKTIVIATLKTLGATRAIIFQTYIMQVGILASVGIVAGLILGAGLPVLLGPLIATQLPIPAIFTFYSAPLVEAAVYGVLAALIFTLWPLAKTEDIRAATLFRDALSGGGGTLPPRKYIATLVALVILLIAAAIWFSRTAFLTLWTAGGIAGALGILMAAAWMIRWIARRLRVPARGHPSLRWAVGAIGTKGSDTTSVVLSLGLGLTVLAAVGQIDGNLRNSFSDELPAVAPSYFFVDIQPEQIDGFQARLDNDPAVNRVETAPMLRGIITQINGESAQKVAGGHWVVRGDRGITYADAQPKGTEVTAGAWWPEGYTGLPQISFSQEEAAEMGLKLGDTMTINVLGRDITGEITSFRNVSWEDAGIGFVLALNQSALAGAPHSWIATVYAEPQAEAAILRDLASAYPNITAIRIRDAIDQVIELVAGIAAATRYGALITLLTGFLVLIGAAAAGERTRTYEAAVLKTLGASRRSILTSFALRAGLLGLSAGIVALAAGILGGWAVTTFIMDTGYSIIWANAFLIIGGGIAASVAAGLGFAWRSLGAKPASVLRARE